MARLADLDRYLDPGLTLGGVPGADGVPREYTVPLPTAELGLWCQRIAAATGSLEGATPGQAQAAVDELGEPPDFGDGTRTLAELVLGDALDEMLADGVAHPYVQFCAATAFVWIVAGEDAAAEYWQAGGRRPEQPGPANRAERRLAAKTGGTRTGAASATKRRASTSGTRSRPTSTSSTRATGSRGSTS